MEEILQSILLVNSNLDPIPQLARYSRFGREFAFEVNLTKTLLLQVCLFPLQIRN